MDIVEQLRGHAKGNAGGVRELLVLSADEIERLRLSLMTFADNVKETNAGIDKNWAETVNSLKANNERLRQQNAKLVDAFEKVMIWIVDDQKIKIENEEDLQMIAKANWVLVGARLARGE